MPHPTEDLIARALARREPLFSELARQATDCYRLFHGISEGRRGLAVDRYGPILLVQSWREPIPADELEAIERVVAPRFELVTVYNHRHPRQPFSDWHAPELPPEPVGRELGVRYDVQPRHRGQDPLLFLDLRAGRRWMLGNAAGLEVLNLFAYTCGMGVCAAVGGAREVVNVDFSTFALEVGRRNAELNDVPDGVFHVVQEDVIPMIRQLAGLSVRQRRGRGRGFRRVAARQFDLVVLDPPKWSTSAFGAVDVRRDYQGLFKPAVLATRPGGRVFATNHVAEVELDGWLDALRRCAEKAGRAVRGIEVITPEADFPSFDERPPLKMAIVEL